MKMNSVVLSGGPADSNSYRELSIACHLESCGRKYSGLLILFVINEGITNTSAQYVPSRNWEDGSLLDIYQKTSACDNIY